MVLFLGGTLDVIFHVRLFRYSRPQPRNVRLIAATSGAGFLDRFFDRFTGFARTLLNPAQQFFLFAFDELQIAIRELGPFLFQFALGDVPVAFDFECSHNSS